MINKIACGGKIDLNLEHFPKSPGVYIMKDKKGKVIYVGKAKQLRQRIKQYFVAGGDGRMQIPYLIAAVQTIETIVVDSEKEALLLENTLIKKHQPKYNVFLKDDKSYISLKITHKHPWPRISLVRQKGAPKDDALYFGPYTSAEGAKQTLELINRLFPLRRCSDKELMSRQRPCLLYQMKKCIAPCVGYCTAEEYREHVKRVILLLKGKDREVIEEVRRTMQEASDSLEFEKAGQLLGVIRALEKTVEKQKVHCLGSGSYDACALYRQGEELVIAQLFIREGQLQDVVTYFFSAMFQNDEDVLRTFLHQHYSLQGEVPKTIYISCPLEEGKLLEEVLKTSIQVPLRGEKKDLITLAETNAKAAFEREKQERGLQTKRLFDLQESLKLLQYPTYIECFDTSHLSGEDGVAAMVVYVDGIPKKGLYRKYKIKASKTAEDYSSMYEVLRRRYRRAKEEGSFPDLLIVDGGKGQLNIAIRVLKKLDITMVDVIALAKEEGRHDKGMTAEKIYLPERKDPINLKQNSSVLYFLQQIRDEAHRYVIAYHRQKRQKRVLKSVLDGIPGIGPVKKKMLLKAFGSVKGIGNATDEELCSVQGVSIRDVQELRKAL